MVTFNVECVAASTGS